MEKIIERILAELPQFSSEYLVPNLLNLIAALAIFFIGKWAARRGTDLLGKFLEKQRLDAMLAKFLVNITYYGLLIFVILATLGRLGIQTASFIAVLGAAGLAIGLALQGSLSNFAAGALIVLFRPFKFGDFIEAGGVAGTVTDIQIFNTVLSSPDNIKIIVPNSQVLSSSIKNYTALPSRRVEIIAGVSYKDDLKKVRAVLQSLVEADSRVLKEPACVIAVKEMAESSVNFVVRPWVKSSDYWSVFFDLTEKIKLAFDENGISIPFPQRDVHLYQAAAAK